MLKFRNIMIEIMKVVIENSSLVYMMCLFLELLVWICVFVSVLIRRIRIVFVSGRNVIVERIGKFISLCFCCVRIRLC